MADVARSQWIERRAAQLWQAEGCKTNSHQACWDKAVEEFEAGTSEEARGPAHAGPAVESDSNPSQEKP